MWQMGGPGPMLGQVHHFVKYNHGKAPYAEERYLKEAHRLYKVLNTRLEGRDSSPTNIPSPTSPSGLGFHEVMHLAEHRAGTAHLPHQPLDDAIARVARFRQQLAGLVGEIDQDHARLHQRDVVLAVDDRRDSIVWRDLQKVGCELLVFRDVDGVHRIGQTEFFQCDGDLAAIRRRPSVEIDHNSHPSEVGTMGTCRGGEALTGEACSQEATMKLNVLAFALAASAVGRVWRQCTEDGNRRTARSGRII